MSECVFCKIVKGELPSIKIWEDKEHLAFLDIYPNTKGMTLLIPKKHFDSDETDMPDESYKKLMIAVKKVSKFLEKGLKVKRVAMVMEGMEINHVHIKLYPLHGLDKKFKEMIHPKKIFFKRYEGYISTQIGPKADIKELQKIADKIKNSL